ncbi:hypothetical protein [Paenibacillus durus]|uniref:hypothetical protein n=1 Tax=Paenibacillus durus TaxID=44251 RepID=UPI0012DBD2E5|nr:hypothetical protein [Paenibacillus durus]
MMRNALLLCVQRQFTKILGLITLYSIQRVTIEQFTRIQPEQQALAKHKAELESVLETQKDTEEQFRAWHDQQLLSCCCFLLEIN